jgi:hypothetical protein
MHPFIKFAIAAVAEFLVIAGLFASVDSSGGLHHRPAFSEFEAILWTFASLIGFGFVICWLKRSA